MGDVFLGKHSTSMVEGARGCYVERLTVLPLTGVACRYRPARPEPLTAAVKSGFHGEVRPVLRGNQLQH